MFFYDHLRLTNGPSKSQTLFRNSEIFILLKTKYNLMVSVTIVLLEDCSPIMMVILHHKFAFHEEIMTNFDAGIRGIMNVSLAHLPVGVLSQSVKQSA